MSYSFLILTRGRRISLHITSFKVLYQLGISLCLTDFLSFNLWSLFLTFHEMALSYFYCSTWACLSSRRGWSWASYEWESSFLIPETSESSPGRSKIEKSIFLFLYDFFRFQTLKIYLCLKNLRLKLARTIAVRHHYYEILISPSGSTTLLRDSYKL